MTPDQAAREIALLGARVRHAASEAVQETAEAAYEEAQRLSSGMWTRKDQRRAGHPYARRRGRVKSPFDPVVISFQSGRFLAAWELRGALPDGDGYSATVRNDDPKATMLHKGTRFMLGRPLPETVEAEMEPVLARNVERRLKDVLK